MQVGRIEPACVFQKALAIVGFCSRYIFNFNEDLQKFLESMVEKYGLANASKAMRCLLDYAESDKIPTKFSKKFVVIVADNIKCIPPNETQDGITFLVHTNLPAFFNAAFAYSSA